MIELPHVSERIVSLADIALFYDIPSAGLPSGRSTSQSLLTIAEFLREVIRNPFPSMVVTLPAIPPILGDETNCRTSGGKRGTRAFRPPGSPEETISTDYPSTIWAKRCLEIVERLLAALEGKSKNVPRSLINDAIEFGALIPRILEFYNDQFQAKLTTSVRRKKNSRTQADNARKGALLTDRQWDQVKTFIERKKKAGVSVEAACRQASAQLATSSFPRIRARIEISAGALQKRWTNRLKGA